MPGDDSALDSNCLIVRYLVSRLVPLLAVAATCQASLSAYHLCIGLPCMEVKISVALSRDCKQSLSMSREGLNRHLDLDSCLWKTVGLSVQRMPLWSDRQLPVTVSTLTVSFSASGVQKTLSMADLGQFPFRWMKVIGGCVSGTVHLKFFNQPGERMGISSIALNLYIEVS